MQLDGTASLHFFQIFLDTRAHFFFCSGAQPGLITHERVLSDKCDTCIDIILNLELLELLFKIKLRISGESLPTSSAFLLLNNVILLFHRHLRPSMMQQLLRRLVFDVPMLSEYCKIPLRVSTGLITSNQRHLAHILFTCCEEASGDIRHHLFYHKIYHIKQ